MMIPQLPVIEICATNFFVDTRLYELRQVNNPFNTISFHDLAKNDKGFVLIYDMQILNLFLGSEEEFIDRKDLQTIQLPTIQEMDPAGFMDMCREDGRQMRIGR